MNKKTPNPKLVRIGEIVACGIINLQAALAKSPLFVRELELSPQAKLVLRSLRTNGNSSLVELRSASGLKRAALDQALKELSVSGLVSVTRNGRKLVCRVRDEI